MVSKGNFDFFNKSIQMILPPRLLLPLVLMVGTVLNWAFNSEMTLIWFIAFALNISSFLIAIPKSYFEAKNLKMWLEIPQALGATLLALTGMREANRRFIHTPHQVVGITEI